MFKSTIYPEWYAIGIIYLLYVQLMNSHRWHERIQPWVHYIPIQNDLSDLWDALTFFRGEPGGAGAHDDLARKIAEEGRRWSKRFWREEDMATYMFRYVRILTLSTTLRSLTPSNRLFLEYARVMHPDRDSSAEVNYNHWETEAGKRFLDTKAGRKYLQDRELWKAERMNDMNKMGGGDESEL